MNPVVKVALHPIFITMAVLSFLSSTLPQYFHLPAVVEWALGFGVALLTLVIAQMKAVHQDLAVPVQPGVFHLIITACTWASLVFQLLSTYLAQAASTAPGFDGATGGVPFMVPLYVYGILAIGKGLADVIANQLHLESSADGEPADGGTQTASVNIDMGVPPPIPVPAALPPPPGPAVPTNGMPSDA